jgi:hypothetical protein
MDVIVSGLRNRRYPMYAKAKTGGILKSQLRPIATPIGSNKAPMTATRNRVRSTTTTRSSCPLWR